MTSLQSSRSSQRGPSTGRIRPLKTSSRTSGRARQPTTPRLKIWPRRRARRWPEPTRAPLLRHPSRKTPGTDWLVQDWLSPLLLAVVGVAFVYVVTHPKRARRTRFQPGADWSEAVDWARDVERYGFDSYWVGDHPALFRADCWTAPGGARRGHSKTVTRHVRVLHGVPQPGGPRSLRGRSSPVECWTTDPWCWERRPSAGIRNARLAHWDRSPARRDAEETVVVVWRLLNGGKVSRDGRHVHLIDVELDAVAGGFAKPLTCRL